MRKYLKIGIYGIWGVFLFLASMEKFGDLFAVGTGFWSVVMLSVSGLCQLLASISAIGWAVLDSGSLRAKYLPYKIVNNYTVPVLIIVLAFVASSARSSSDGARAQKLGFKDSKEFSIARENNIFNMADYAKFTEELRIKAAEKAAQDATIKERKAKEDETKKQINTVPIEEVIPDALHQKQIFTMIKKYYKGKIYPQDNPKGWVFVRILIQGDTMLYGDNYKRTAKYIGSTDGGYDVFKSNKNNVDEYIGKKHIKHTSYNVVYFNKNNYDLKWKIVIEDSINNDNGIRILSGFVPSINGY
ncbi:TPA: hypothetical protein HIN59_002349 [Escherichia coli]|nr:hypothetical protein [Escherichia coli]